jgi:hypothetical protein
MTQPLGPLYGVSNLFCEIRGVYPLQQFAFHVLPVRLLNDGLYQVLKTNVIRFSWLPSFLRCYTRLCFWSSEEP